MSRCCEVNYDRKKGKKCCQEKIENVQKKKYENHKPTKKHEKGCGLSTV